jgi:TP901 family phage tail tape measure protein
MSGQLNKAASGLKSFGDNITKIGTSLTTLTAPLALAGATGVKMAMDLDREMKNIQAISKQTDAEIAALSDTFIEMSTDITKTTDSAINLASAFYDVQGSGFAGADAMTVLEAATKAATAGLTTTEEAASGITAVLNSYGKSADEAAAVSDIMFRTVDRGVGTFGELSSSMSNVVGMANALGVPFEEVSAAMATMSKQGFSFSEASVAINQAMSSLIKPTAEGQAIIEAMGFASGEAMVDALGFAGAIEAVAEHTGGSVTEMSKLFSNVRGLRGALALTGAGADMFAEDMAAMADATGATAESFATQTKSFEAQFKNFQNNLNAMLIEIGQILLPIINDFLQNFLLPMIQAFRNLPEPIQKAIVIIGALVTILGPLLIIIGSVISAIGTIGAAITALGGMAGIVSALGAAFAAITGPIGIAVIAIVGSLALLKKAWDRDFLGLRTKTQETVSVWRKNFDMLGEIVALGVNKIVNKLSEVNERAKKIGWFLTFMEIGTKIGEGLIKGFTSMGKLFVNAVKALAKSAVDSIKNAFKIRSPSKVMMKLGEQVVEGFNRGIDTMNGIGVQVPALAPASASVSPMAGSPATGGGNFYMYGDITVPVGTTQEQIRFISRELGKKAKQRGGIG